MCSWKRRDARLVPYIARFICHMYPVSSSPRGGYISIGSPSGSSACQNATLMSKSASTRECPPLVFLIGAALEMMILMHLRGAVPANVSNRTHEWSICFLFHLIKPLTSDFRTSSHRDRNTFKQLMSCHCIVLSLSSNLHQVWRQPFTCLVVIDWSVVYLVCGNVTHRNLVDKNPKENTQEDRPPCSVSWLIFSGVRVLFLCAIFLMVRDSSLFLAPVDNVFVHCALAM